MAGTTVVVFDFDHTMIEDNSDTWVVEQMGLTPLFNQLRRTLPWTSLMDRMMEELHARGKTIEEITECLRRVPMNPSVISAIRKAHSLPRCELRIIGVANQFFIETILKIWVV
ncbi:inorganic pyrophosphatase 2-like [Rhododendron vialii]|uniref:inorganic pyrophosphatase 2-like n=1 Tax=Rhododendron vialii TaxID=182163 RepID=UPI00265E1917|nr:inorganic pyrophosphatase 2-like [Rhododendron vialii]